MNDNVRAAAAERPCLYCGVPMDPAETGRECANPGVIGKTCVATPPDAAGPDLERLAEIAEKATPGPWYTVGPPWLPPDCATYVIAGCEDPHGGLLVCNFEFIELRDQEDRSWEDAEYIAAFDPPTVKALLALARRGRDAERELAELRERAEKAEAFKRWTHDYLDRHGVPHHPPGTHGAAGCRIGDRMDWLMERVRRLEEAARLMVERCNQLDVCLRDREADVYDGNTTRAMWRQQRDALAALVPAPEVT